MTYRRKSRSKFYCAYHNKTCRGPKYLRPSGVFCDIAMLNLVKESDEKELAELRAYLDERIKAQ